MLADDLKRRVDNAIPHDTRKRFCVIACHVLWRELCHFAAQSPHVFDFHFLEQGLHNTPERLREELQRAVDARDGHYDALLIGYGLCSNGLQGLQARHTPIVCVRAHDCITFLLGSKERYREYFDTHPGTYWYSPGWIEDSAMPGKDRYDAALKTYIEEYGEESARYLMEATETWISNYNNAAYVDLGIGGSDGYRDYTRACAAWLGWQCDALEGDTRLLRDFLNGVWDDEAFLVVPPGYMVAPSFDERILEARPIPEAPAAED